MTARARRRLPRRHGLHRHRGLSDARRADRRAGPGQRLHRHGHLLPVHPARIDQPPQDRPADHPRLPLRWDTDWFWCSRASLTQNRRSADSCRSGTCAAASTGSHRTRPEVRHRDRLESRKGRPRAKRVVQDIEVPIDRCEHSSAGFSTRSRSNRCGCAVAASATRTTRIPHRSDRSRAAPRLKHEAVPRPDHGGRTAAWPLYPSTRTHLRQRGLLVLGADRARRARRRRQPGGSKRRSASSTPQVPLLRFVLHRGRLRAAVRRRPLHTQIKKRYDPDSRLLDLYSKAVQRK